MMHDIRRGFSIYQVFYGRGRGPTKMKLFADDTFRCMFRADDDDSLEGEKIHIWIYLKEISPMYCYVPMDGRFSEEMWSTVDRRTFHDVDIQVGERAFTAHRFVLSARSPVFEAMFKTEMLEASTGRVQIDDVDSATFETFLKFLYTGTLHADADYCELQRLADKYQVETLRALCDKASLHCEPIDYIVKMSEEQA